MENNYDIKYVVAALVNPGFPTFYPIDAENVMGYYVSKAFVVSEETKYDRRGEEYKVYDIVLPYGDLRGEVSYPEFNKCGNLINGYRVYEIYDSRKEAEEVRDKLNINLRSKKILSAYEKYASNNLRRKKIEEVNSTFDYYLNECEEYELALLNLTSKLNNQKLTK